jgi:hypothetical protein
MVDGTTHALPPTLAKPEMRNKVRISTAQAASDPGLGLIELTDAYRWKAAAGNQGPSPGETRVEIRSKTEAVADLCGASEGSRQNIK